MMKILRIVGAVAPAGALLIGTFVMNCIGVIISLIVEQ